MAERQIRFDERAANDVRAAVEWYSADELRSNPHPQERYVAYGAAGRSSHANRQSECEISVGYFGAVRNVGGHVSSDQTALLGGGLRFSWYEKVAYIVFFKQPLA